ncbi:MAG: helix-turn-helix domain-containing protein [Ruminococcaceae bacterium]|nr:helix-turn-helix domain-containing protein [Oscillospiraceae bacterium]
MIENSYSYSAYADMKDSLFDVKLKSCGHIFAKNGRRIKRPSGRDDWLLFYVAKGTEHFNLGDGINAPEGSFVFFKPSEPQEHVYNGEQTAEFYYIHFTAPKGFALFGFESSRIYKTTPSLEINEMFEDIIKELQAKDCCYEKICIAKFFNIVCLLERMTQSARRKPKKHADEILAIIQMMNKEYGANHTLSDYAEMARMSKFYFIRAFKEITGSSPLEYRAKIRLKKAAELLSSSNMTVGEITSHIGFNSQNYFCDAFKKHYGLSPTEYRNKQ